jgi:ribulose-phosphate 3-epimerase
VILAPSILAADLGHLAEEVAAVERGGAGEIHVDVMDGQFVPNLTLGPAVVKAVRRATRLPVGAHLMVERGERYIDAFIDAGVSSLSLHVEAVPHLQRAMAQIRERGAEAGVALNPASPLSLLEEILPEVDRVLLMTVNPGFSFQEFLPSSLDKIRRLRDIIEARGLETRIQIDGGVTLENVGRIVEAGATIIVAGAASFADGNPEVAARRLIEACG